MQKVYVEIGIGNPTFISTEIEEGDTEYRIPRFIMPNKIKGIYIRLWIGKKVLILSTHNGFETQLKPRNNFKFIFGLTGTRPA